MFGMPAICEIHYCKHEAKPGARITFSFGPYTADIRVCEFHLDFISARGEMTHIHIDIKE